MNQSFEKKASHLNIPSLKGRYDDDDCMFVLKDIETSILEEANDLRESKMTQGVHYSEMLPIETMPSPAYLAIFHQSLHENAQEVAQYVADMSEMVLEERGRSVVLVSLARAGTPVGVLMKRYMLYRHGINVPHYSISIIRGKGFDENALVYILKKHARSNIMFVDGWTGKGAIGKELTHSVQVFNTKYEANLSDELAVLADPAGSASIYGTREDFFLPSSCLNAIVSGLVSRTLHREDLIGENDYHGAKYYKEWEKQDVSRLFVDEVTKEFPTTVVRLTEKKPITMQGWHEIESIKQQFGIININKIKPSIGETTRVLLRRVPWKILVKDIHHPQLKHILVLAKEKQVPIEIYPNMSYACIGLIKESTTPRLKAGGLLE